MTDFQRVLTAAQALSEALVPGVGGVYVHTDGYPDSPIIIKALDSLRPPAQ